MSAAEDFPVACERCLGDNPYLRMTKEPTRVKCALCERPCTLFRWRHPSGRQQATSICQMCAKSKNLCQVCLLDLEYSLPSHIRDALLPEETEETAATRRHRAMQLSLMDDEQIGYDKEEKHQLLLEQVARRGLKRALPGLDDSHLPPQLRAPDNPHIRTLHVGGVPRQDGQDGIGSSALGAALAVFGAITKIQWVAHPRGACALVTFAQREDAERAVKTIGGHLALAGRMLPVQWARRKADTEMEQKALQERMERARVAEERQVALQQQQQQQHHHHSQQQQPRRGPGGPAGAAAAAGYVPPSNADKFVYASARGH